MNKAKHRTLTQDKICQAALEIINREGLESLSMRRLAQELNVEAASLYNHIKNKSALLDLIQDSLFKLLPIPKEQSDWKKYLYKLAYSIRNELLKYPNVVPLFVIRHSITASALEKTEQTFNILHAAGFKYSDIIFAYQSLGVFVLGHLQAEVGNVPGEKEESEPSFSNELDAKRFPHLTKAHTQTGFENYDGWFNFGITAIITGLENILYISRKIYKNE